MCCRLHPVSSGLWSDSWWYDSSLECAFLRSFGLPDTQQEVVLPIFNPLYPPPNILPGERGAMARSVTIDPRLVCRVHPRPWIPAELGVCERGCHWGGKCHFHRGDPMHERRRAATSIPGIVEEGVGVCVCVSVRIGVVAAVRVIDR